MFAISSLQKIILLMGALAALAIIYFVSNPTAISASVEEVSSEENSVELGILELSPLGEEGGYAMPASGCSVVHTDCTSWGGKDNDTCMASTQRVHNCSVNADLLLRKQRLDNSWSDYADFDRSMVAGEEIQAQWAGTLTSGVSGSGGTLSQVNCVGTGLTTGGARTGNNVNVNGEPTVGSSKDYTVTCSYYNLSDSDTIRVSNIPPTTNNGIDLNISHNQPADGATVAANDIPFRARIINNGPDPFRGINGDDSFNVRLLVDLSKLNCAASPVNDFTNGYAGTVDNVRIDVGSDYFHPFTKTLPLGKHCYAYRITNNNGFTDPNSANNETLNWRSIEVVDAPTVDLKVRNGASGAFVDSTYANPFTADYPADIRLAWSSTGASSCSGTGFATGGAVNKATLSVVEPAPNTNRTYTITCNGAGGSSVTDSVTVFITGDDDLDPDNPTVSLNGGAFAAVAGPYTVGNTLQFKTTQHNKGNLTSETYRLRFRVTKDGAYYNQGNSFLDNLAPIGAGGSIPQGIPTWSLSEPGNYTVEVRTENPGTNNRYSSDTDVVANNDYSSVLSFTVNPAPNIDLTPSAVLINGTYNVGNDISFESTVTNQGALASGNFSFRFRLVRPDGSIETVGLSASEPSIAGSGASRAFTASGYSLTQLGTYSVQARVEAPNSFAAYTADVDSPAGNDFSTIRTFDVIDPLAPPPPPPPPPSADAQVTLTASPANPTEGDSGSVTLTWTVSNAASCSASSSANDWQGSVSASGGNASVPIPVAGTYTYRIDCDPADSSGNPDFDTAQVIVAPPPVVVCQDADYRDIQATPPIVRNGGSTVIRWTNYSATASCELRAGNITVATANGQSCNTINEYTTALTNTTTFTLVCTEDPNAPSNPPRRTVQVTPAVDDN